jgi:threonine dehydrogenase-like Zn-dependent dehydrogenase
MIGSPTAPLTIEDPAGTQMKELSIAFTVAYDADADFLAAVELLANGTVDVGPLTSGVLPLDQHAEAFSLMRRPEAAVKLMLSVGAGT